ncbi:MAG TPA: hypothetical protein VMV02_06535 [Acidimicrobiales bacterium]|nr:hypothetical protein [Acidimicrobiales bacterium]
MAAGHFRDEVEVLIDEAIPLHLGSSRAHAEQPPSSDRDGLDEGPGHMSTASEATGRIVR